jgi:hypothetical protein
MHGLVMMSLHEYVEAKHGTGAAAAIFAGDELYLATEAYPDERFRELVRRASAETGLAEEELLFGFGVFAGSTTFARLFPAFFESASSAQEFLLGIEQRIHELVRATIPGASPPQLFVSELDEGGGVLIVYTSSRRLCRLLRGLAAGTASRFGEVTTFDETSCMLRGDLACRLEVRLSPGAEILSA